MLHYLEEAITALIDKNEEKAKTAFSNYIKEKSSKMLNDHHHTNLTPEGMKDYLMFLQSECDKSDESEFYSIVGCKDKDDFEDTVNDLCNDKEKCNEVIHKLEDLVGIHLEIDDDDYDDDDDQCGDYDDDYDDDLEDDLEDDSEDDSEDEKSEKPAKFTKGAVDDYLKDPKVQSARN